MSRPVLCASAAAPRARAHAARLCGFPARPSTSDSRAASGAPARPRFRTSAPCETMPPGAPAAAPIAWNTLDDMLASDSKLQQLQYMRELRVFDDKPLHEESLAVLAARVGEARSDFLSALLQAGVDAIGDRQLFANALVRGVREGRITRGWAKPPPETCAYCGSVPAKNKKLLTCGRCKSARYCNASCQKAHWGAGHKTACKPPAATPSSDWAKAIEDVPQFLQPRGIARRHFSAPVRWA